MTLLPYMITNVISAPLKMAVSTRHEEPFPKVIVLFFGWEGIIATYPVFKERLKLT